MRGLLLVLILAVPPPVLAQWQATGGPAGGRFFSLVGLDEAVLASTSYSTLRHAEGEWMGSPTSLYDAVGQGSTVVGATREGSFVLSTDGGATFSPTGPAPGNWRLIGLDDTRVFSFSDSVRVSEDGGASWTAFQDSAWVTAFSSTFAIPIHDAVGAVMEDDALLIGGTAYVFGGVYRLAPSDTSWVPLFAPGDPDFTGTLRPYGFLRHDGALWFSHSEGVHRSTDGGETWDDLSTGLPTSSAGYTLHAGSAGLVVVPRGVGDPAQWNGMGWDVLPPPPGQRTALSVGSEIWISTPDGVFRLEGAAWAPLTPVVASSPLLIEADAAGAVLVSSEGVARRSTDQGATFTDVLTGLAGPFLSYSGGILASTITGLHHSSDGGVTWQPRGLPSLPTWVNRTPRALVATSETVWAFYGQNRMAKHGIILERFGAAFRSADGGSTWTRIATGLPTSGLGPYALGGALAFGDGLLVKTEVGCFGLTDGQTAWTSRGCPGETLRRSTEAGGVWLAQTTSGVWASANQGTTWTPSTIGLPAGISTGYSHLAHLGGEIVYVAAIEEGTQAFRFDGAGWVESDLIFPVGLTWTGFGESADGDLYGGTYGQGLWRLPASSTTTEPPAPSFDLAEPYPNPATGRVRLAFTLSQFSPVVIEVVDGLGRRIATLANRSYPAGSHVMDWEPDLVSGTYVLRLQAGEHVQTRRVTLVR